MLRLEGNSKLYQFLGLWRQNQVLFLDEPFSALDYEMTLLMREKLQTIYPEN